MGFNKNQAHAKTFGPRKETVAEKNEELPKNASVKDV